MQKLWNLVGRMLFWISRPAIWLVIRFGPPRTRVVVMRQDKILLVKDWLGNGRWKLAGGGLRWNEAPPDGAVRELREEVHLSVQAEDLHFLGKYRLTSSGAKVRIMAYWLELEPSARARVNGKEITAGQWVTLDKAFGLALTEATQAILEAFRDR